MFSIPNTQYFFQILYNSEIGATDHVYSSNSENIRDWLRMFNCYTNLLECNV